MVLSRLFGRNGRAEEQAAALYLAVVAQARAPEFYHAGGVPDTLDGRFEAIVLHMFLVLHRLADAHGETAELGQALFDRMFADMDQSLREMGAGDMGVGKRVRRMAEGFMGRVAAYRAALAGDGDTLEAALTRNLYGTLTRPPPGLPAMAAYVRAAAAGLAAQPLAEITAGRPRFPAPPAH